MPNNSYRGEDGLLRFLNPARTTPTPLVELPSSLNPLRKFGIRIHAKLAHFNPLLNIKAIPAYGMLMAAMKRGELEGVHTLVESSSSNTALSLAVIGRQIGISRAVAVVDEDIAPALANMLRLFGAEVRPHARPSRGQSGIPRSAYAAQLGQQPGWFNPNQYLNPDNPGSFANVLGSELLEQFGGEMNFFACGLGATGTVVGCKTAFKAAGSQTKVVGCVPPKGEFVPGPREEQALRDTGFGWAEHADALITVAAVDAYRRSLALLRSGLMAGPSSGLNLQGLIQYLTLMLREGSLEELRDDKSEVHGCFLCCDSPLQHIDEYFEVLSEELAATSPCERDQEVLFATAHLFDHATA